MESGPSDEMRATTRPLARGVCSCFAVASARSGHTNPARTLDTVGIMRRPGRHGFVAQADIEAQTPRQRRVMKPRDQHERRFAFRLTLWIGTFSALLLLTPINRIAWLAIDVALAFVWCVAYVIWYRRRTPAAYEHSGP